MGLDPYVIAGRERRDVVGCCDPGPVRGSIPPSVVYDPEEESGARHGVAGRPLGAP